LCSCPYDHGSVFLIKAFKSQRYQSLDSCRPMRSLYCFLQRSRCAIGGSRIAVESSDRSEANIIGAKNTLSARNLRRHVSTRSKRQIEKTCVTHFGRMPRARQLQYASTAPPPNRSPRCTVRSMALITSSLVKLMQGHHFVMFAHNGVLPMADLPGHPFSTIATISDFRSFHCSINHLS
jgi:hypothetical protein